MGPGHQSPPQPARPAPGRPVARARPGDAVRLAGFRLGLQADHPGPAVVPAPAAADHGHLHLHLRQRCQAAHRRPAAVPVLHVRYGGVELLLHLHDQDLRHLHLECQPVRQGIFPAPGGAGLDPDFKFDPIRDPVPLLPVLHGLLCAAGLAAAPQPVDPADATTDLHDGRAGPGPGCHNLLADHQVPRPALSCHLRGATLDVCHPGDRTHVFVPAALPLDHPGQPDDADCGDIPLRLPGGRHGQFVGPGV